jgi:hypothetical protein
MHELTVLDGSEDGLPELLGFADTDGAAEGFGNSTGLNE